MASRFILSTFALLGWCVLLHLVLSGSVSWLYPSADEFASFPFASVHLAEEAMEGSFHPLREPPFETYLGLMCVFVFLLGGYWASSRLRTVSFWIRLLPVAAPLALMAVAMRVTFAPEYPAAFRTSAIASLALFAVFGVSGALSYSVQVMRAG